MKLSIRELEKLYEKFSDEDLKNIVTTNKSEYEIEAINTATNELVKRGVPFEVGTNNFDENSKYISVKKNIRLKRLNRLKFNIYYTLTIVFSWALYFVLSSRLIKDELMSMNIQLLMYIMIFIQITLYIRRFRDMDLSFTELGYLLIPIYNLYEIYVLMTKRGTVGENRYGKDPLEIIEVKKEHKLPREKSILDVKKSLKELERKAKKNDLNACYQLSLIYFEGDSVLMDKKKAAQLMEQAFSLNHPEAKQKWEELELWKYK